MLVFNDSERNLFGSFVLFKHYNRFRLCESVPSRRRSIVCQSIARRIAMQSVLSEAIQESDEDPTAVKEQMPWLIDLAADQHQYKDLAVSTEHDVGVILHGYTDTSRGAYSGCEYGVYAKVYRDSPDNKTKKYWRWRHPTNSSMDQKHLHFDEVEIVSVNGTQVRLRLRNTGRNYTTTVNLNLEPVKIALQDKLDERKLNEEQIDSWREHFCSEQKRIKDLHYRDNATMSRKVSSQNAMSEMTSSVSLPNRGGAREQISYDQSRVTDTHMVKQYGIGAFVVKAQIDAGAGRGKQFEWVTYLIDGFDEVKKITRMTAYESELKNDIKTIETDPAGVVEQRIEELKEELSDE